MERASKINFIVDILYALLVIGLLYVAFFVVLKFLWPFVLGVAVSFAVQKTAFKISKKTKLSKGVVAAILSFLLYLILALLGGFLVYKIAACAVSFTGDIPNFFEKISSALNLLSEKFSLFFERAPLGMRVWSETILEETVQNIATSIGRWITDYASKIIKRLPLFFVSGVVTLVASCYIAKDFDALKKFAKSVLGERLTKNSIKVKNILIGSVFKMVRGYFLLLLITFAQLYLGFLILRIDKAFTLAVLISIIDILPVLGTGIVIVPWAFFEALFGNYFIALGLGILYVIIIIVRNFSEPKIIGKQLGINALFTLITMFLGLKTFGVAGLVLLPVIFIVTVQYYRQEIKDGLAV